MIGTDKTFDKLMRKYKLMALHNEMIRKGKYAEARLIMELLTTGKICIGLSDAENTVERLTENLGCHKSYGHNYNTTTIYQ